MKKIIFLVSATSALLMNAIPNTYAYDTVYVFGDSLSDGGNKSRFTTDGKDAELYDEYIARKLTNKKLIPSKNGGTNYAEGGATANGAYDSSWDTFVHSTQQQLDNYLKAHDEKADPNGVYLYWIGGNNISRALVESAKGNTETVQRLINGGSASAASQINRLLKDGAGLVIVPDVPDVGITPKVFESVIKAALQKSQISQEQISLILQKVHAATNHYPTPNNAIRNQIIDGILKGIADKASPQDQQKAKETYTRLHDVYDKTRKTATQFSDQYNQLEESQLDDGNILRAKTSLLLQEIIENPTIYGITNTLGYACPQDKSVIACSSSDPNFDKSQVFLFSDYLHPTPYLHHMIGQYIMSIYNAPLQVMALNPINRIPVKMALSSLDGHLQQLRNSHHEPGKVDLFGGVSGSHNATLTLGSDYQLTDNLLLGATISRYRNEQNATSNFNYAATGHVITAYTQWDYGDNGWLSGDLHYSLTHYDNLSRTIQLGQATRREEGSTTGKQWGWRVVAGWNIPVTDYLTTSPIIQYSWDKGNVDGYHEAGFSSTAMHFSDQHYRSSVGSVGWRVDTQLGSLNPYASVLFKHQFNNEHNALSSAINITTTHFVQQKDEHDKDHLQYTVGVNANLTSNLHAFAAVSHEKNNNTPNHDYYFNLGLSARF